MGTIIAVCILSAGIGVALGYWIKTLKYWHDMETGSLAKDSISDKNMSDLKDEITRLELENKKLEEENENLKRLNYQYENQCKSLKEKTDYLIYHLNKIIKKLPEFIQECLV